MSRKTNYHGGGESMTKQADAFGADINNIMATYQKTGVLPFEERAALAQFADVSEIGDFATCVNHVRQAQQMFDALPAELRERFGNDPALLMSAVERAAGDEGVRKALEEIGVLPSSSAEPSASSLEPSASGTGDAPAAKPADAAVVDPAAPQKV